MRSRLPELNRRVLTVILLVGLPVLLVGVAIVISIGQARLHDAQRERLSQIAEYTAGAVDAYVFRTVLDTALLARVPDVRQAAAEGSARPFDLAAAMELDRQWQADRAATSERSGLLRSTTSQFLAELARHDSIYREILVTDRQGRLVAASNVTSDYFQADEDWWIQAFHDGRGRISVTDVRRDESAGVYAFEMAVPVPAPSGDDLVGVMKIVADSRELLAGIGGLELGTTAEAILVRPNGSIVFRRRPHNETDRFFAADLLRERLEARMLRSEPAGPFTFRASTPEGTERLVIMAPSQLAQSFPNLNWYVAVSLDRSELMAPFRSLIWYLVLVFALTAIAVLAIALWVSLRLAAPPVDPEVDMHLVDHPRVPRLDYDDATNVER